ncbi:hypothetical protein EYC80_010331 [Monilinia laxa]|uniref:Uncharacterized protein n=1 Tax=Monilinia laxa TaxID=61186 RepID=A0A5N6JR53_MONLA|nr:hypothetical protein EYC80_010331 [Monilinia laxa]
MNENNIKVMNSDKFELIIQPLQGIKEEVERDVSEGANGKIMSGENIEGKEEEQEELNNLKEKTGKI